MGVAAAAGWLIGALRQYPEVVLLFAVGLGFWLGNLKIGWFSFGTVTASLLAGLAIGNLGIEASRDLRWGVFMLFLFANGYSVGPQFVRALKSDGVKPMLLSAVVAVTALLTAYVASRIIGLDPGLASGMFSGAVTQSAAIGTSSDAITGLMIPEAERNRLVGHVVVADALCYVFGAIGMIWFCGTLAPKLLRVDLRAEARALEGEFGIKTEAVGVFSAKLQFAARAHTVPPGSACVGRAVWDLEIREPGRALFIVRIRRDRDLIDPAPETTVAANDVLVLYGHTAAVLDYGRKLGPETADPELLDIPMATLSVVVTSKDLCRRTMAEIRELPAFRGVTARSLLRGGLAVPPGALTHFDLGDVVELVGPHGAVERAAAIVGYVVRPSVATPLSTLGVGIFAGALVGLPALVVGPLRLSLTISVGVLLAGLFAGWLRSVRPVLPPIPEPALQFMINFGLAAFVAGAGLHAGPLFIDAVRNLGAPLLVAGVAVTLVPQFAGLAFGHYVLKMRPLLLLGALSGAQTYTGALAAVQEKSGSRVAVLGYTVPYATSNVLLTLFGAVLVALVAS
jgi:putative transport protein